MEMLIGEKRVTALLDTGASLSIINEGLAQGKTSPNRVVMSTPGHGELVSNNSMEVEFKLGNVKLNCSFAVVKHLLICGVEAIIGYDIIRNHNITIKGGAQTKVFVGDHSVKVVGETFPREINVVWEEKAQSLQCIALEDEVIEGNVGTTLELRVVSRGKMRGSMVEVMPTEKMQDIILPGQITNVEDEEKVPILVLNYSKKPIPIKKRGSFMLCRECLSPC